MMQQKLRVAKVSSYYVILNSEDVYATLSGIPVIQCTKIQNTGSSYLIAIVSTYVYKTRPLDYVH